MRRLLLPLAFMASPASAAERRIDIGSFDRVRVEGPLEVTVVAGGSPTARVEGADAALLQRVRIEPRGTTLVVRGPAATPPIRVALSTPRLAAAGIVAPGKLSVSGVAGDRVDLVATGGGSLSAVGVTAGEASALLVGEGAMTLAGRARTARLVTNGVGALDAAELAADELRVTLEGAGATTAQARYAADVIARGTGRVTVAGRPRCTVRVNPPATVACGAR